MSEAEIPVLVQTPDQPNDYTLLEGARSVWITVGNIAVYVYRTDEGVVVDLYPASREMATSVGSTWALFSEVEADELERLELLFKDDGERPNTIHFEGDGTYPY